VKEKEVVIFVPFGVYSFDQQLATALYLASQSEFRPHFLLIAKKDHAFIEQLESVGISYNTLEPLRRVSAAHDESSGHGSRKVTTRNIESLLTWFPRFSRRLPGLSLTRLFFFGWRLWIGKRVAQKFVQQLNPRCAVVAQERIYPFFPILKSLQEMRVPIILMLPAEGSPDGAAWLRRDSYLLKSGLTKSSASPQISPYPPLVGRGIAILNRMVQRWLPSQVYDSPWGKILFYPAMQVFLLKIMGMLPLNPWYQGTTFADYIMISGVDESAMYAEARVDPVKLLFFGSHELDLLYEGWPNRTNLRHQIFEDYHLDHGKSILIVNLPRLWEQGGASEEVHWQSINDILEVLSHQDHNVLISLHPSSNLSHYSWIEEKYALRICRESLEDILVIADIYVTAYSSTIRWAIALGTQVIILDLWSLNYKILRNLTGYQTVTTVSQFAELARNMATIPQIVGYNSTRIPDSDETGVLVDGRAKERLISFIESLDSDADTVASGHTSAVL
jgi:hypothetical protein